MLKKINSRKLLTVVLTAVLTVLNDTLKLGISNEAILTIVGLVAAYVVGQGIADHGNQGKKSDVIIAKGDEDGPNWEDTTEPDEDDKRILTEG
jgi:hypothetical protein